MTEQYAELGGQPSTVEPPARAHGCGQPSYRCDHPDGHECPFLSYEINGHAVNCGCTHEPPPKGRK